MILTYIPSQLFVNLYLKWINRKKTKKGGNDITIKCVAKLQYAKPTNLLEKLLIFPSNKCSSHFFTYQNMENSLYHFIFFVFYLMFKNDKN